MRNLVIAISGILFLIWLFVAEIYVAKSSEKNSNEDIKQQEKLIKAKLIDLNMKKLASLLKVEYLEVEDEAEVEVAEFIDVKLSLIVIYTSESEKKLRINKQIEEQNIQADMKLGDKLYDYSLITIAPSFAVFSNGENDVTLQIFKSAVITVSQAPKEVSEQL